MKMKMPGQDSRSTKYFLLLKKSVKILGTHFAQVLFNQETALNYHGFYTFIIVIFLSPVMRTLAYLALSSLTAAAALPCGDTHKGQFVISLSGFAIIVLKSSSAFS